MLAQIVTVNAQLQVFSLVSVEMDFTPMGEIQARAASPASPASRRAADPRVSCSTLHPPTRTRTRTPTAPPHQVLSRIDTISLDLYSTPTHFFRAALEVLFVLNSAVSVRAEARDVRRAWRHGYLGSYLFSLGPFIDWVNLALCWTVAVFWGVLAFQYLGNFDTPPRWDVYEVSEAAPPCAASVRRFCPHA